MNFFKLFAAALFLALIATQGASAAEPVPPVEAGGFFDSMDGAIRDVGRRAGRDLADAMSGTGYSIAATLNQTALAIAGGLGLIYLFYEVMQFLSGRTKSMLVVLFDVGIPCLFAAAFITSYPILLPKFELVLDVFRNLGSHVAGGGADPFEGIMGVYTAVFDKITTAIRSVFTAGITTWTLVTEGPQKFAMNWIDLLATLFFCLALVVLLIMGVAEVLGLLLIGPFLFAVGVAFGPIMIAGLVTPWTRDYFTKWLQFIVISAALQGVMNVIFTIAFNVMEKVGVAKETGDPTAVSLLIIAILLLTINSMVSQAPSIASALFPGHVGVSKSSGTDAKQVANKLLGKRPSGDDKSGKGVFGKTAKNVAGFNRLIGKSKTP